MTDKPIIFSASMILAILAGRKTQTRRKAWGDIATNRRGYVTGLRPLPWQNAQPGDRLWVREAGAFSHPDGLNIYRADLKPEFREAGKSRLVKRWTPSIHMPRWASRLTLTVTEVRRQRLQDITNEDALAEGALEAARVPYIGSMTADQARDAFALLWDHLHGDGAWQSNPEIVALSFTVEQRNIDAKEPS